MSIFIIILFTIIILACAYLVLRYLVIPMPKSSEKTLLFIATVVGTLLFSTLLILATFIPNQVNTFIDDGIAKVEENINTISPDYIHEEQDPTKLKEFLSNYKQIQAGLESNDGAQLLTELIGVNTYIKYLNFFTSSIDTNLQEMEEEHIPLTLHNIFMRVQEKSQDSVLEITRTIEIAILIITLLFFIVVVSAYFLLKHEMSDDGKVIIAGETN